MTPPTSGTRRNPTPKPNLTNGLTETSAHLSSSYTRNAIESKRLDVVTKREERLAKETRLNVRLLAIQANSAELEFEAKREALNMERRIKIIATRKRLKDEGWSDVDVELACPLNLQ
ncbi:hypothetical protein AC1031_011231 [Aphanomyces cochlioides]|nr:hypothetical protein AC1031_011231 [Aphanomyces cochlioides]